MNQEKIGKFILELRTGKKMTQQELADKLNITDKAVSKWENGRCMPDLELIKPLCEILGVTINELLSGEKLTEENYQQKLEENMLRISLKDFKSNVLKGVKLFLFLVILVPFLTLAFILGYTIIQEYRYAHINVPSSEVNLEICKRESQNKIIYISAEHKGTKTLSLDTEIDEKRIMTLHTFRYRSVNAYEYPMIGYIGFNTSDFDEIYYDGKLVWNKDIELPLCEI